MSKSSNRDFLEQIFQLLTDVNLDSLPPGLCYNGLVRSLPNRPDLDQSSWYGLSIELNSTFEGVTSLRICWAPSRDHQNQKEVLLLFKVAATLPFFEVKCGASLNPGHWTTLFCAEVMLLAHRLANGLDETPTQPVRYEQVPSQRDDQVVMELASSARRKPDLVPDFKSHRIC